MVDVSKTTAEKEPRVAILLAVFNGARFLEQQIETLERQTVATIDIWVSDDGSTDGSIAILAKLAANWRKGEFRVAKGPGLGFAENFRALMTNPAIDGDYFAFCDQDDVWDDDKLADALAWLASQPVERPALYCTRTRSIDEKGTEIGCSPLFKRVPSFRNAIVQSIAGANTIVMNKAAWTHVREAARRTSFVSHDWWCYLIVTGVGGTVHYSPRAKIGYRQHGTNLVGENHSWRARMSRLSHLMKGRFVAWNQQNMTGLVACQDMLTPEARETIHLFARARNARLVSRLAALARARVYRQTLMGQVSLFVACMLKRL